MEGVDKTIVDPLGSMDQHEVRNKQSERHYRWVTPDKASKRQMQGYKPVAKDDPEVAGSQLNTDGHRTLGRKVLMYCPRHMKVLREQKSLGMDVKRREAVKSDFHAVGDKEGFQTFEVERHPKKGGGFTEVEKPGAPGRGSVHAMGAGIDPETGDLDRVESLGLATPPPGAPLVPEGQARRTMMEELKEPE